MRNTYLCINNAHRFTNRDPMGVVLHIQEKVTQQNEFSSLPGRQLEPADFSLPLHQHHFSAMPSIWFPSSGWPIEIKIKAVVVI